MRKAGMIDSKGFTLLEMGIVLTVIGLIVGGVLVGTDLIRAAQERAMTTQLEKYQSAVNTFQYKFNALPGDMPAKLANQFGFAPRGPFAGEGDGNGMIQANQTSGPTNNPWGWCQLPGETSMFWEDLSTANLIDGNFSSASETTALDSWGASVSNYFPAAKLASGLYVYVFNPNSGTQWGTQPNFGNGGNAANYFGISAITTISPWMGNGKIWGGTGISVRQAYDIDNKIDDGLPQSGNVLAIYVNGDPLWTDGTDILYAAPYQWPTSGSTSTCYDNNGAGGTQHYSIEISGGNGLNCALSFVFN